MEAKIIRANEVKVGGAIKTTLGLKASVVEIGKGGTIEGFVVAEKVKIRAKAKADTIYADEIMVEKGAKVKSLFGKRIYLRNCKIEGNIFYTETLEIEGNVRFAKEPQKVDKLPELIEFN